MQIKSIVSAAVIALAATVGSASAGEMLTLSAIPAEPLTVAEMEQVRGTWIVPIVAGGFHPGKSPIFPPGFPPGRS